MSCVDSDPQREDGHNTSPIWVSDRPEGEQAAASAAKPSAPITTYAPMERASLRDLMQQPRFRRLGTRALVALAVGVVVGFLVSDWRLGVTAAIVAAILDTVYRARSNSTVPAWRRASVAERRTEAQLRRLERNGYRTLHARAIPGSGVHEIDRGPGVFLDAPGTFTAGLLAACGSVTDQDDRALTESAS